MELQFDIGIPTLSSYDDDGFLSMQYDGEGEDKAGLAEYEAHHMLGFMARPLDPVIDSSGQPDAANSGQMLFALEGGKGHSFALQDPRVIPNLPALLKGESLQYGCAGNFTRHAADGSITRFTTDAGGAAAGRSVYDRMASDGFSRIGPWGKEVFDNTGYHLLHRSGARVDLGAVGGLPSPLDAISSYFKVQAGAIRLTAGIVALGPAGVAAEPAAKGTTLLLYLAMLAARDTIYETFLKGTATATTAPQIAALAVTANTALALLPQVATPPDILASVMVG